MSKPLKRTVTPRACPPNRPQPTQPSRGHETQPCTALEHLKLLLNALFPPNNCLNLLNARRKPLKRTVTGRAGPPNHTPAHAVKQGLPNATLTTLAHFEPLRM